MAELNNLIPLLERLVEDQRRCWLAGQPRKIEEYVAEHPALATSEDALLDFIFAEICLREELGESVEASEYEDRFPHLKMSLSRLFEAHEVLRFGTLGRLAGKGEDVEPAVAKTRYRDEARLGDTPQDAEVDSPAVCETDSAYQPANGDHSDTTSMARAVPRPDASRPARIARYQVERELGMGSFGTVYLAYDEELHRQVAIKVPRRERLQSQEAVDLFRHEARTAASLRHPGIVVVYDVLHEDGLWYIVSEYIAGESLKERIQRDRPTFKEAAILVAKVAEALHCAHLQDFIHRDVKPANILLDREGRPHVADFGLALREDELHTKRGLVEGTLKFMSPEQVRGEGHRIDARTDIYSLGVVLYELLCGRAPFQAATYTDLREQIEFQEARPPRTIDDRIPPVLELICLKAISKRIADRYTTAKDMAKELLCAVESGAAAPVASAALLPPGQHVEELPRAPAVVPKGLRAFEAVDANFFLELLPGPRDAQGMPDSVRFWKTRIEGLQAEEPFTVGLIYGPSGCGKSSLVKAGLLPRLAGHVTALYLEATAEGTERRVLAALRRICPRLHACDDLGAVFREVRCGHALPSGQKLCVVLDQFEQWLHAQRDGDGTTGRESDLLMAMRQADGEHLQCLLMVRDDFWVSISRLFQGLEVPLVDGQNSRLVDLFDTRHAGHVLELFGRAYGCLPKAPAPLSADAETFLARAINGLSEQGRVISVRLSLFAEMMKGRPWSPQALAAVGGIEGIGVTFLEGTFCGQTAPPEHRLHQEAARAVLHHMLPAQGSEIRGMLCPREELLQVSGYSQRPKDFQRLLGILDAELRIITPAESLRDGESGGSSPPKEEPTPGVAAAGPSYQLTHDYLVPALRDWLNRKRKGTRRGRAEMLMEERGKEWGSTHQDRSLPSLRESLFIALFTQRKTRSPEVQGMLRRAWRMQGVRLGGAAALFVAFALLVCIAFVFASASPRFRPPIDVLADTGLPAETRLKALPKLNLKERARFERVIELLMKDQDPGFVGGLLEALFTDPGQGGQEGADRRNNLVECAQKLPRDVSLPVETRIAALTALAKWAEPAKTLSTVNHLDLSYLANAELLPVVLRYIKGLDLSRLPEDQQPETAWRLSECIRTSKSADLVAGCCAQLDMQPVGNLCEWLIEARRLGWDDNLTTNDENSIAAYSAACGKGGNMQRSAEIGRHVQGRLVELVNDGAPKEDRDSVELKYLIQAMGPLQTQSTDFYNEAFDKLERLLHHWEGDQGIVAATINTYVAMWPRAKVPQAPIILCDILEKREIAQLNARVAAARGLGSLQYAPAMRKLIEIADKEDLNVRIAAIDSLGKMPREAKGITQVCELLRRLLRPADKDNREPADVIEAALLGFAQVGAAEDAKVLFPWTLDHEQNIQGIAATSAMIQRSPAEAPHIACAFLKWLVEQKDPGNLHEQPDEVITNMAQAKGEVKEAVMKALENLQKDDHQDERVRTRAEKLLRDLDHTHGPAKP